MRTAFLLILFACASSCAKAPKPPEASTPAMAAPAAENDPLTDRFWTLAENDGRTGVIRAFLSDGTMLQGSCGEPYRLSAWRRGDAGEIVWNEDGVDISADILEAGPDALTIGLNLRDGPKVERYAPAAAPFVCPDLPR